MATLDTKPIVLLDDETRNDFNKTLSMAIRVSNGIMGIPTTRVPAIASQLLTQNVITGLSIASFIDPVGKTNFPGLPPNCKVFDLPSLCILTRGLIEAYLAQFYIAVESVADSEKNFRLLWWDWHEINERIWSLECIGSTNPKLNGYKKKKVELHSKVLNHSAYSLLPPKLKREFEQKKSPSDALLKTRAQIAAAAGINLNQFRVIYKHCSQYTHAQPLAISVLSGLSAISPELPILFRLATRHATSYLLFTVRDFIKIFPKAEEFVEQDCLELINFWSEIHAKDLATVQR